METLTETEAYTEAAYSLEQKLGRAGGKILLVDEEERSTLLEPVAEPTFCASEKARRLKKNPHHEAASWRCQILFFLAQT